MQGSPTWGHILVRVHGLLGAGHRAEGEGWAVSGGRQALLMYCLSSASCLPPPSTPLSVENLSSAELVPDAKNAGDCWSSAKQNSRVCGHSGANKPPAPAVVGSLRTQSCTVHRTWSWWQTTVLLACVLTTLPFKNYFCVFSFYLWKEVYSKAVCHVTPAAALYSCVYRVWCLHHFLLCLIPSCVVFYRDVLCRLAAQEQ